MQNQQQHVNKSDQSYNILCDKVFYERLKYVEEGEYVKIIMFPVKNILTKQLNFVVIDLVKSKPSVEVNQFKYEEFLSVCQSLYSGASIPEVFTYLVSKQSILLMLSEDGKKVKISCPQQTKQLNQLTKQCVILTLTLPSGFYQQNDCYYNLQGYKFNSYGKVRQGWSYVNNGRVLKAIIASKQNEKIKMQLQQNKTYSKNEIRKILEIIQCVNNGGLNNQENKLRLVEKLKVLGENYCHSEKFVSNSNSLIPILNFDVGVLCSMTRGQSCKNKIEKQPAKNYQTVSRNICLNFSQGIEHCQHLLQRIVQQIFTEDKNTLSKKPVLLLSNMPTKISNPHLFLKTQFKEKFQQFYVKGFYEYFHYGDHNFNDQGWGCAYRSLETLLSWFRLQQKLNLLTVPTVSEIQNLIDIIDCTSQQKLSNTNTWIGATEVSWVVKKLTGFDCRIIHIQDGKDIVEHAQIFRDHLQNVGTPIMYGGGQYAYSIVGINYSWKLGEIMFLILDPHYNGSDKIQKIIEKKGICWRKPQEMFKKGVFYNFCLPIL